jgi:MFS family permease
MKALVGTSVFSLGINAVWIAYNSVILPYWLKPLVPANVYPLTIGIVEAVGISIALMVNIIVGIISDHFTTKRFGHRAPIMFIGSLLTAPFLLLGVFLPITLPLAATIFIGMQFFTNVSAAAFQPTLADFVPENQRGISAGLKGLFILVGAVIGGGAIGPLLGAHLYGVAYIMLAVVFILGTIANVVAMRPYDKTNMAMTPIHLVKAIRDMFRLQKVPGGFYWFVLGSFLIYMGLSSFQADALVYLETVLHYSPDQAVTAFGIFGGVSIVVSIFFAVLAGYISDRIGRRNLIIGTTIASAIFSLLFPFIPQLGLLLPALTGFGVFLIVAALYSASIAMVQSVDTALTSDLVPQEAAGKYMGYANLAQGTAGAVAPLLFGIILNLHGAASVQSFTAFFIVTASFFVISIFIMALKVANK